VLKRCGVDDGALYAMKVVEKNCLYWGIDVAELMIERRVLEMNGESEFLVGLHYAFQTRETVHLITGEYVKSYMYGCRILPDWRKCPVLLIKLCQFLVFSRISLCSNCVVELNTQHSCIYWPLLTISFLTVTRLCCYCSRLL
jgi:hypothetical protein